MKNDLDNKLILKAFSIIRERGEQVEKGHFFEGVTAYTDFDGYTLYFETKNVLMSFGFHNTYHLDYHSERDKKDFLQKMRNIVHEQNTN